MAITVLHITAFDLCQNLGVRQSAYHYNTPSAPRTLMKRRGLLLLQPVLTAA